MKILSDVRKRKIKDYLLSHESKFLYVNFFKWKLIDVYRGKKHGVKPHLFGIRCVVGMYGQGKSVSMTWLAMEYRKKYGNDVYICSNYGLGIQDFPFSSIDVLTKDYDKPIIFFWDEVQNDFPATDKVFPKCVRQALTLNRHGNGKMIYWASQDHELVHKTIRRLTIEYGWVKTLAKRLTRIKWYTDYDYQCMFEENDVNKKMKIHPIKRQSFVQTDYLRSLYNSFGLDNGENVIS